MVIGREPGLVGDLKRAGIGWWVRVGSGWLALEIGPELVCWIILGWVGWWVRAGRG